jgi:hypothetical protein
LADNEPDVFNEGIEMLRFAEIGFTAAGVVAGLLACGPFDAAILGVVCWGAFNAVCLKMVGASAVMGALLLPCWHIVWISFQLRTVPPPDAEIPFTAVPATMGLAIVGAFVGAYVALLRKHIGEGGAGAGETVKSTAP